MSVIRGHKRMGKEREQRKRSGAAAPSELYADHDLKPEFVVGPEVLQPQYVTDVDILIRDLFKPDPVKQQQIQAYENAAAVPGSFREESPTEDPPTKKPLKFSLKIKTPTTKLKLVYDTPGPNYCKACNKTFKIKRNFLKHSCIKAKEESNSMKDVSVTTLQTQKRTYPCNTCSKEYMHCSNLIKHLKTHAEEITLLHTREVSKRQSTRKDNLICQVADVHTEKETFHCKHSEKQFTANQHLKKQIVDVHPKKDSKSCHICKKRFKSRPGLVYHLLIHAGEKSFTCDVCKKQFRNKSSLEQHKRSHTEGNAHSCHICRKEFKVKAGLDYHLRIHAGEKSFTCDVCKKQFRNKSSLKQHKHSHTEGYKYSCHICKKEFKVKAGLVYHLRIHAGEKSFTCDVCNKQFRDESFLKVHKHIHTTGNQYSCKICKKQLTHKAHLAYHMKMHTGEKPHSSAMHEKQVALKSTLDNYSRTDTKERPYSCETCDKRFIDSLSLAKHKQSHLKPPQKCPFSCDICNRQFKLRRTFTDHKCGMEKARVNWNARKARESV